MCNHCLEANPSEQEEVPAARILRRMQAHRPPEAAPAVPERRRKLWELTPGMHCAVLGTCLTLDDLRKAIRQSNIAIKCRMSDYDLHRGCVQLAQEPTPVAKRLHKRLESKYARHVDRLRQAQEPSALAAFWRRALAAGEIPGAFWALLTHPALTEELRDSVYGEVHMLSHFAGANQRRELRRIQALEQECAGLRASLSRVRERGREKLAARDRTVAELRQKLARLEAEQGPARERETLPSLKTALWNAERALDAERRHRQALTRRVAELEDRCDMLRAERMPAVHPAVPADEKAAGTTGCERAAECPRVDLCGKGILYVGGRQQVTNRLRHLVEMHNGRFLVHDGGLEESMARLEGCLSQADVVVCPIDCISHDACLKAKHYCKQHGKRFVPLRSAGLASFERMLPQLS